MVAQRCSYSADGAFACSSAPPLFPSDGPFRAQGPPAAFSCKAAAAAGGGPGWGEAAQTRARSSGPVAPGDEPFKRPAEAQVPAPFVDAAPMPVDMFAERIAGGRAA